MNFPRRAAKNHGGKIAVLKELLARGWRTADQHKAFEAVMLDVVNQSLIAIRHALFVGEGELVVCQTTPFLAGNFLADGFCHCTEEVGAFLKKMGSHKQSDHRPVLCRPHECPATRLS